MTRPQRASNCRLNVSPTAMGHSGGHFLSRSSWKRAIIAINVMDVPTEVPRFGMGTGTSGRGHWRSARIGEDGAMGRKTTGKNQRLARARGLRSHLAKPSLPRVLALLGERAKRCDSILPLLAVRIVGLGLPASPDRAAHRRRPIWDHFQASTPSKCIDQPPNSINVQSRIVIRAPAVPVLRSFIPFTQSTLRGGS